MACGEDCWRPALRQEQLVEIAVEFARGVLHQVVVRRIDTHAEQIDDETFNRLSHRAHSLSPGCETLPTRARSRRGAGNIPTLRAGGRPLRPRRPCSAHAVAAPWPKSSK